MNWRKQEEAQRLTLGALLLAGVLAIGLHGCAIKDGATPPDPRLTVGVVQNGAALSCNLAVPVGDRDEARAVLARIRDLAENDPAAAYEFAQSREALIVPAVGFVWNTIHLYLDATVTDAAQWTALAQQMIGAAATGCLAGLGPVVPEVATMSECVRGGCIVGDEPERYVLPWHGMDTCSVYSRPTRTLADGTLTLAPCPDGERSVHGNCWRC